MQENMMTAFSETDGYEKLSGCVEGIIYANEENGYTVCDLGTDDDDIVTITGIMPYLSEGDRLVVYGEWKHNPKYGTWSQSICALLPSVKKKMPFSCRSGVLSE